MQVRNGLPAFVERMDCVKLDGQTVVGPGASM
jgi:hypothetical protein